MTTYIDRTASSDEDFQREVLERFDAANPADELTRLTEEMGLYDRGGYVGDGPGIAVRHPHEQLFSAEQVRAAGLSQPAQPAEEQRPADLLDDLWERQHRMSLDCWCGPVQDGIGIYHRDGKVAG